MKMCCLGGKNSVVKGLSCHNLSLVMRNANGEVSSYVVYTEYGSKNRSGSYKDKPRIKLSSIMLTFVMDTDCYKRFHKIAIRKSITECIIVGANISYWHCGQCHILYWHSGLNL